MAQHTDVRDIHATMSQRPQSPHDKLFKQSFGVPERAAPVLRTILPAQVAERLDWSTLTTEPGEFQDPEHRAVLTDLMYSVQVSGTAEPMHLYLLTEHQSEVDDAMALRMLRYTVTAWYRLWEGRGKPKRLPVLVPLVVSHAPGGWTAPLAFNELVQVPAGLEAALEPFIPKVRFLLDDLAKQDIEALRARKLTEAALATLWMLAHARQNIIELLTEIGPELSRLVDVDRDAFMTLTLYISQVTDGDRATVEQGFDRALSPTAKEAAMTLYEKLIEEGESRGEARGRLAGQRRTLAKQLQLKFGQLDSRVVSRLEHASEAELELWTERVLTADSLDGVLE